MKYPRFRVVIVEGWTISGSTPRSGYAHPVPGISATVCDSLHQWREVKTYRSEDHGRWPERGGYRGREQTVRDAEDHAAFLNKQHQREQHAERVRAGRAEVQAHG